MLVWVAIVFEVATIGGAGLAKFANATMWTGLFEGWGYPRGFSYVVGSLEVAGAILLLVPLSSSYAAGLLIAIMTGALGTVLSHPGQLGPVAPVIHLALLVAIAVLRWPSRKARRPLASGS